MTKVSKSPERHTFEEESYLKRCAENNKSPDKTYLNHLENIKKAHAEKFVNHEPTEPNLEYDLVTTDWMLEKVRGSRTYSQHLYAAMCNNNFVKNDVLPLLKDQYWHCSWRYAGGIIADMRQEGDYIDWYCSGCYGGDDNENWDGVPEGAVTEEIEYDLRRLGWLVVKDNNT